MADRCDPADLLVLLHGVPMLVRTVDGLLASGVVGRILLVVRPAAAADARRLLPDRPVTVHTGPRETLVDVLPRYDVRGGSSATVVLHDVARPLTPPSLARAVVAAADVGHAVAVPALPLSDTVKDVDPTQLVVGSPDRGGLRVVQTPQAFRSDLLGDEVVQRVLADPGPVEHAWAVAGAPVATVPGHPLAFPVRSPWDRELAEVLAMDGT